MSTTTYLQLCQQAQDACEISGTAIQSISNQTGILNSLVTWVANADVSVQLEAKNWDFLYKTNFSTNTVDGTATYNKPTDYGTWDTRTFFIDYSTADYLKLRTVEYRKYFNTLGPGVQETSQPNNYIIEPGGNIILYNTPDKVYALTANYWKTPTRMTANTSTSDIPENYIRVIIARTKMYYAISEEADRVYQEALEYEYTTVLNELKADQLPSWKENLISDGVELTVSTDGFTSTSQGLEGDFLDGTDFY